MSDEWNWNDGQPSLNEDRKEKTEEDTCCNVQGESTENAEPEAVESAETGAQESGEAPHDTFQEPPRETYHWVNPEYQRRQQGTANAGSNTYENNSYRENVGQTGYRGGAYHSDWRNQTQSDQWAQSDQQARFDQRAQSDQQNQFDQQTQRTQQGRPNPGGEPVTGQRRYGTYQFTPEKTGKSPKKSKPMGTGKKFLMTVGFAVVFGLVAGGVMFGVNYLGTQLTGEDKAAERQVQIPSTDTPEPTQAPAQEAASYTPAGEFTVSEVASACMPSVVSITNASVKTVRDFFGGEQEYPIESSGSGIIVGQNEKELLIATNNHVVEGADTITVAFNDDAIYEAQLKGNAEDSDLAVIAVKLTDMTDETLNSVKVVTLGDSDTLQIGEQVVAIGNALGYGQSVTSGWVSAVGREVLDEDGNSTGKLIQTDAAINPGNSGGALLNMRGELIGINSAKAAATEVEGMGYAIPIATAQPILDELMNRETRFKVDEDKAAYIGVTCLSVDSSSAQMYGIPVGAFVDSVEEGGPADTAGIQKGDVITKFDGLTISGSTELVNKLEYYEEGETVEVVISRAENGEYKEQTVTVTLGRRKDMKQSDPQQNR